MFLTIKGEILAKRQLSSSYEIKNIGKAKLILEMCVEWNNLGDVMLSQQAYSKWLLKCFNIHLCLSNFIPLLFGLPLFIQDCPSIPTKKEEMKGVLYREALSLLIWL